MTASLLRHRKASPN